MIGRVGDDPFGEKLKEGMREDGVDVSHIVSTPETATGAALISVASSGENSITVIPGANGLLTSDDVAHGEELIARADVLVVQFEVPLPTVAAALAVARRHDVLTVLDPAPAPESMTDDLYDVDVLTPNETEAEALTGVPAEAEPERAASRLCERGAKRVVLTLGAAGAFDYAPGTDGEQGTGGEHVMAFSVESVDTTAAGDAFTAALAVGLARGDRSHTATRWAAATGALTAMKLGAQPSLRVRPTSKPFSKAHANKASSAIQRPQPTSILAAVRTLSLRVKSETSSTEQETP